MTDDITKEAEEGFRRRIVSKALMLCGEFLEVDDVLRLVDEDALARMVASAIVLRWRPVRTVGP